MGKNRERGDVLIDLYRCIIKSERGSSYLGKDYNGRKYKIIKNSHLKCKVGADIYFYAKIEKGLIRDTLIPVSDEEAGVVDNNRKSSLV